MWIIVLVWLYIYLLTHTFKESINNSSCAQMRQISNKNISLTVVLILTFSVIYSDYRLIQPAEAPKFNFKLNLK